MSDLQGLLRDIEPIISAVVGILTLCAATWGALELAVLSRRRAQRRQSPQGMAAIPVSEHSARRSAWASLMNLGVGRHSRLEELVSVRAVNVALFCIGGIALPWLALSLLAADARLLSAVNLFVVVCVLLGFALQWSGNTAVSRWLVVIAAAIYWLGALLAAGAMQGTDYFLSGLVMLPVLIFSRGQRAQMFLAIALIALVFTTGVLLSLASAPLIPLSPAQLQLGYHLNAVLLAAVIVASVAYYRGFAASSYHELEFQKQQNDQLVSNLLPARIARAIEQQDSAGAVADWHPDATVLFAGLTGFSTLYRQVPAMELVAKLGQIYSRFDALLDKHGVEKVKTLGTSYVAATGIGGPANYQGLAACALEMREALADFAAAQKLPLGFHCGIATGLAISGVMADAHPRFDVWGEALEAAIGMREVAPDGGICVNETAVWRLDDRYSFDAVPDQPGAFILRELRGDS